jgi:hypothetical protein
MQKKEKLMKMNSKIVLKIIQMGLVWHGEAITKFILRKGLWK